MNGYRPAVVIGGLCGAAGVALSAAAAHGSNPLLGTAASMLLVHAPAFLAIGLLRGDRILRWGFWLLLAGLSLFSCDLAMRVYAGTRLFPMAAPAGGTLLIAGWLVVTASALWIRRE
ncbi:MAG TPA: DUF423 domain-containing protein [Rhizobiaceae bacterium]|nr:DUF423 domain-containing protein [Rhizobiaceae bacterium]